ncbi:MAG: fibronectin type III domain-containing protein [Bradymonadia bacterium]
MRKLLSVSLLCLISAFGVAGCGVQGDIDGQDDRAVVESTASEATWTPKRLRGIQARAELPETALEVIGVPRRGAVHQVAIFDRDEPEADVCEARCGADPICLSVCEERQSYEDERHLPGIELCNVCSRETGFRPVLGLRIDVLDEKTVRLEWDALAGADRYTVISQTWPEGAQVPSDEESWENIKTPSFEVELEIGERYGFMIRAYNMAGEHLQRSRVVFVEL